MLTYTTKQGDTWDFTAYKLYKQYGGELLTSALIDANPEYISTVIFPAGITLNVPDVYTPASRSLPPWMRQHNGSV